MPSQEVLGLHPTDLIPHTTKNYWSKFQQTHCFPRFAVQFITRFAVLFPRFLEFETPAQYLAIGFKGTGRHRKGRFFAPLFDYAFGPSTSVDPIFPPHPPFSKCNPAYCQVFSSLNKTFTASMAIWPIATETSDI